MAVISICSIEGCGKKTVGRGWCRRHYSRWKRTGETSLQIVLPRICSIPDCGKTVHARGWCIRHYDRWKTKGDPLKTLQCPPGEHLAFLENIVLRHTGPECLKWPYNTYSNGYGSIRHNGRTTSVHAVVCEIVHGKAPSPSHEVRHLCGNGFDGCCSPHHLIWGTRSENMGDKLLHGTHNRGERSGQSKLTEADVLNIRSMCAAGIPQKDVAKQFGVSPSNVWYIHRRKTWPHLTPQIQDRDNHRP